MKKKEKIIKILFVIVLILIILECAVLTNAIYKKIQLKRLQDILEGKNFSVLGDSLSTYKRYSDDYINANDTIGYNKNFYNDFNIINVNYTWWKQVADKTNMNLLVNNSSSGSKVVGEGFVSGSNYDEGIGIRSQNLHDNIGENSGTNPDIIAVYMGTNDLEASFTAGSYETIDFNTLIATDGVQYFYKEPSNFAEGYAIMLHKIKTAYPNADVFLMNMMLGSVYDTEMVIKYNDIITKLADHYNMNLVDLYNSKISEETTNEKYFIGDNIHPNKEGMKIISNAVIKVLEDKYLK